MSLLRVNEFSAISNYAHALDAFFITAFLFVVWNAVDEFRRGNRIYLVLLVTTMFYGTLLEVSGMIWHGSYTQGEFLLMWNFKQFTLFKDSTDMPFYVPLFYPVWLTTALKLIEPLGIKHIAARAVSVGLACLILDVPYILIAPHVGWWEWHEWRMYQLWMGWPLLDGLWELSWHALLFWCLFRLMPRLDGYYSHGNPANKSTSGNLKALLLWPAGLAIFVNIVGPLLMVPASVPTVVFEGFRHYPVVALYVLIAATVFLFADKKPDAQYLSGRNLFLPLLHFVTFAIMTVIRIRTDGGFQDYTFVQSVALYVSAMIMFYPRYRAKL